MMFNELDEAKEIFKEAALQKIATLIKAHDLTQADILSVFPDCHRQESTCSAVQPAKRFDPFFDA